MKSWEISYPDGLVKYVDYFRNKCFHYDEYDAEIIQYFEEYSNIEINSICTLGCGTGRNELRFTKFGYEVTGIERNKESFPILKKLFEYEHERLFNLVEADFMNKEYLYTIFKNKKFDCIMLLSVPLSIDDVKRVVKIFEPLLNTGGLFIAPQYFGYPDGFNPYTSISESEIAENPFGNKEDFCLRTNIYNYVDSIIDWTSVYVYYDENHTLQMSRDHDILEILRYETYYDILQLNGNSNMKLLPIKEFSNCSDDINMPMVKANIVAWKKDSDEK